MDNIKYNMFTWFQIDLTCFSVCDVKDELAVIYDMYCV